MSENLYVIPFGEGEKYKDAYKAAKAMRELAPGCESYRKLRRHCSFYGKYVVWSSYWYNFGTASDSDLQRFSLDCRYSLVFLSSNEYKECIGTI